MALGLPISLADTFLDLLLCLLPPLRGYACLSGQASPSFRPGLCGSAHFSSPTLGDLHGQASIAWLGLFWADKEGKRGARKAAAGTGRVYWRELASSPGPGFRSRGPEWRLRRQEFLGSRAASPESGVNFLADGHILCWKNRRARLGEAEKPHLRWQEAEEVHRGSGHAGRGVSEATRDLPEADAAREPEATPSPRPRGTRW